MVSTAQVRSNTGQLVRLLAVSLPTAAALGSALPGVGPLFGFRIGVLVLGIVALSCPTDRRQGRLAQPVATLAVVWLMVGAVLTVIAADRSAAARTMTSVAMGLVLAMACLRISAWDRRFMSWIGQGWLLAFAVTSAIALWELATGSHLSGYFISDIRSQGTLPAATFYNPNAYAVFLISAQTMILWSLARTPRLLTRVVLIGASVLCGVLILTTGSRLCLAAFALLILSSLLLGRTSIWRTVVLAGLMTCGVWVLAPGLTDALNALIPDDILRMSESSVLKDLSQSDTSGGRRIELYKTAAWLTWASGGLGVGPGNFGAAILALNPPYATGATLSPHSFASELAAEFGLIVLAGFTLLMISVARRVLRTPSVDRSIVIATGVAFLPASLANSGYLLSSLMWMFFATMMCMVDDAQRTDECRLD